MSKDYVPVSQSAWAIYFVCVVIFGSLFGMYFGPGFWAKYDPPKTPVVQPQQVQPQQRH